MKKAFRLMYALLALLLFFKGGIPASAHPGNNESFSEIQEGTGKIMYTLRIDLTDLRIAVTPEDPEINLSTPEVLNRFITESRKEIEAYYHKNATMYADGFPLEGHISGIERIELKNFPFARITVEYPVREKPDHLILDYNLIFDDVDQWHVNYLTVNYGNKHNSMTFTYENREIELGELSLGQAMKMYLILGMEHLFTGIDHILFLLALLFGARSIKQIIFVVTSFTAAHSITLLLSCMHIVSLPSRIVESVIALSIAYVAIQNLVVKENRHNVWLAFGFGLIHGLGFAGTLSEMRLDIGQFIPSLLSFNAGIELGQIIIVLIMFPIIIYLRKVKWVIPSASIAISLVGVFWFVERAVM